MLSVAKHIYRQADLLSVAHADHQCPAADRGACPSTCTSTKVPCAILKCNFVSANLSCSSIGKLHQRLICSRSPSPQGTCVPRRSPATSACDTIGMCRPHVHSAQMHLSKCQPPFQHCSLWQRACCGKHRRQRLDQRTLFPWQQRPQDQLLSHIQALHSLLSAQPL